MPFYPKTTQQKYDKIAKLFSNGSLAEGAKMVRGLTRVGVAEIILDSHNHCDCIFINDTEAKYRFERFILLSLENHPF